MVASTASSPKATTTKAQPVSPEAGGGSGGGSSSPGPATTDPSAASPPTANGKMTSNNVVVDKTGKAGLAKKPVHVKWHNKTIALGTFTLGDAEDKCRKAKALTRMWRLTMKPKPSYEWVVHELEKAGVRDIKAPKQGAVMGANHHMVDGNGGCVNTMAGGAGGGMTAAMIVSPVGNRDRRRTSSAAAAFGAGAELRADPSDHRLLPQAQQQQQMSHQLPFSRGSLGGGSGRAGGGMSFRDGLVGAGGMFGRSQQQGLDGSCGGFNFQGGGIGSPNGGSKMGIRQMLAMQGAASAPDVGGLCGNSSRGGTGGRVGGGGFGPGDVLSASDIASLPRNQVNPYYELLRQHHMDLLQELQETTATMRALEDQMLESAYSVAAPPSPAAQMALAQFKNSMQQGAHF